MFENLVVGIDGRDGGHDAVGLARQLAAARARVTVAHVYGEAVPGRLGGMPLPAEAEDSGALLERERAQYWPEAEAVSLCASSVGRGLHELAQQRGADLLVIGSCRRGPVGRVLMGDDTRAAFSGAPCAVAIAPRAYSDAPAPIATIGVGYDGLPESERALDAARDLAARTAATVNALRVISWEDVRQRAPIPADWPEASSRMVEQAQQQLRGLDGVNATAIYGGPREELLKLGDESDLLIVGSRGYGPLGSLFHGSVSSWLERRVGCPLLVLPRATSRDHEASLEQADSVSISA